MDDVVEHAQMTVLAHYGLAKQAAAGQRVAQFFHGANPQQAARRMSGLTGGVAGGLIGSGIGAIHGAMTAEKGEGFSGALKGGLKGGVAGTALGAGAGALGGHRLDPAAAAQMRDGYAYAVKHHGVHL